MNSLEEFQNMPLEEQLQSLWFDGTALAYDHENEYKLVLFELHHYFIEVWFYGKTSQFYKMQTYQDLSRLDRFINLIDLKKLF